MRACEHRVGYSAARWAVPRGVALAAYRGTVSMPTRPPSRCTTPHCPALATLDGRCPNHTRTFPFGGTSVSSTARGYDAEYRHNRATVLDGDPPCHWCARPATVADHVIALADGGTSHLDNLVPSCVPCNARRGLATARARQTRVQRGPGNQSSKR